MTSASWSKVSQRTLKANMFAEHQHSLSKLPWCPIGATDSSAGLDIYLSNNRDTEKERNIWIWGWALEVQGRGNSRISCSRLSLFTMHCTHWCSALCNTAQLVKDFMIYPGTLVSRAGWHYFIGYLLWRWFKQSCNKDQNFTRAAKVPGGPIPPFVHHNFLISFVTQ